MNKTIIKLLVVTSLLAILGACQLPGGVPPQPSAVPSARSQEQAPGDGQSTSTPAKVKYMGEFSVNPSHAPSGAMVSAAGKGFESDTELELVWQGFKGNWKVANGSYNGRDFKDDFVSLKKIKTDSSGNFQTAFTVPTGFGFSHDIIVRKENVIQNKSNFNVDMEVAISPPSGPVGTPISIDAKGIG